MQKNASKYRIKLTKLNELKFLSHLDWQNLILKTLRRAEVDLAMSEGFHPMPKVSFSPALPIFTESECELVNFMTVTPIKKSFISDFEKNTNSNIKILDLYEYPQDERKLESLDNLVQWAQYQAKVVEGIHKKQNLSYNINEHLSKDDFFIEKINKKGIKKNINYKKSVKELRLTEDCIIFTLKAGQDDEIPSLRADEFLKAVFGEELIFNIKRTHFLNRKLETL